MKRHLLAGLKSKQPQELDKLLSDSSMDPELALSGIDSLIQQGIVIRVGEGKNSLLFTESDWKQTVDNILSIVREYHKKFPLRPGIPKAEISNKVKLGKHFQDALQKLFSEGFLVEESSFVRLPDYEVKLSPAQQLQIDAYLHQLNLNPYSPAPDISLEPDLLNLLVYKGEVIKTVAGVVFSATAYNEMVLKILAQIKKNGKITVAEARDILGSSRKYVLALLEQMDELKLTKRLGDERIMGEKG